MLLELLSEEIPARMQAGASEALTRLVAEGLGKAGFGALDCRAFVTPRRLVLVVDGLPAAQPDIAEERKGPKVDAPEKAIEGFLKANGVTLDRCERREMPKGTFLFVVLEKKGRQTAEVLKEVVEEALAQVPWPKSMRWATNPTRWVRPLQSILCLFDGAVVPVRFAGLTAGATTRGHRFLAPETVTVTGYDDYAARMREHFVMLSAKERADFIAYQAAEMAQGEGLVLKQDEGLLREVAGLVEWPVCLMGRIDDAFMGVPDEVLSTSMREHQKYFSVLDKNGRLANRFIVVANMKSEDGGRRIVAGNERVLRARLSDARFFWDQDRKTRLDSRVERLKDRVFHAQLGTDWDKVQRMRAVATEIAAAIGADAGLVDRAALLAKADLSTGMVGEFPELQGLMGRYYARHDGEDTAVAQAIAEHYSPLGPSDACPTTPVSVCVALADKIDTLVGFWGIDHKPTGSKDPYALRRAALGVIRLILENGLRLNLLPLFHHAAQTYLGDTHRHGGDPIAQPVDGLQADIEPDLLAFFADRLKVHLREQGVRHDLVAAVFDLGGEDDLVRLLARVEALRGFVESEEGANLLAAYRRAMNIVRIEEKKDGAGAFDRPVDEAALAQDEEKALAASLGTVTAAAGRALESEDFQAAMAALAGLRAPVDAFFDKVTVNAEDPALRVNRLRLLSAIGRAMGAVAEFSRVES
jgi:glycyl-tRNA synthetase beta chain